MSFLKPLAIAILVVTSKQEFIIRVSKVRMPCTNTLRKVMKQHFRIFLFILEHLLVYSRITSDASVNFIGRVNIRIEKWGFV